MAPPSDGNEKWSDSSTRRLPASVNYTLEKVTAIDKIMSFGVIDLFSNPRWTEQQIGIAALYRNRYPLSSPVFSFFFAMLIQSERVQKALTLSNTRFKRLFGVKRATFNTMLEILEKAFEQLHKRGGKPATKLRVEDRLLVTLQYYREYRTMEHLAYEYDTVKAAGSVHDFTLYKSSTGSAVSSDVKMKVDSGYQGIVDYHANSEVPFKKTKNRPLTAEEKAFNRRLARERIAIEHVNRQIKVFKLNYHRLKPVG